MDTFEQQPAENLDYDFDYTPWLAAYGDSAVSYTITADTGLTVGYNLLQGGVVKTYISGGEDGERYKLTCTLTTAGTRVKQVDCIIKIKEI